MPGTDASEPRPLIGVLVAEDDGRLRTAICDLVSRAEGLELVAVAADADEAIERARALAPEVALLDVRMPGGGGLRAAREISVISPATRSIALAASHDRSDVLGMLRAGTVGYVLKGGLPEEVVEAIRRAARGQSSLPAAIVSELVADLLRESAEPGDADDALLQSEACFLSLLESIPDAVALSDANGRIELANEHAGRLFGYTREELIGQKIETLLPRGVDKRRPSLRSGSAGQSHTRAGATGLESIGRRKDGSALPISLSLAEIEADEGPLVAAFVREIGTTGTTVELDRATNERRALLAHLVSTVEDVRGRIAADLHDDAIQVMTVASMRLEMLRRSIDGPEKLPRLNELEQAIQLSLARLRHLIVELRPPALEAKGLSAVLHAYLAETADPTGTSYRVEDMLSNEPSGVTRLILYRITQEALTNIRAHAAAANATVTLEERGGGYQVAIRDDGAGFSPESLDPGRGELGLAGIREWAEIAGGWLRIESAPNDGTTVEFWIPAAESDTGARLHPGGADDS
jgi:PAS domain S-box-containing protein